MAFFDLRLANVVASSPLSESSSILIFLRNDKIELEGNISFIANTLTYETHLSVNLQRGSLPRRKSSGGTIPL